MIFENCPAQMKSIILSRGQVSAQQVHQSFGGWIPPRREYVPASRLNQVSCCLSCSRLDPQDRRERRETSPVPTPGHKQ